MQSITHLCCRGCFASFQFASKRSHEIMPYFLYRALSAKVVTDRNSGFSKGFGFVKYATLEDAAKGIEGMDAKVGFIVCSYPVEGTVVLTRSHH